MTAGLNTTFEVLAKSRNDASNSTLLAALENVDASLYEGALKAIIARRNKVGHVAVLQRWHTLTPQQREFLQEGRGRMSAALRDAVLSEDAQLFANGCEVVEYFAEFDLVATLVTLAENQKSNHAAAATQLVLRLVQQLSDRVHGPRDYQDRRNPEAMSRFVLESLERSVERFRAHNRSELIEAFVVLSGPTSSALRAILEDPYHACYLTVINTLTQSKCVGVIELLLRTLGSELASLNVLNVISKRTDTEFVTRLLNFADQGLSAKSQKNLSRIRSFAWLQPGSDSYANFSDEDQARCIKLVVASGVKTDELLDMLEGILTRGGPTARWAACEALATIPGDRGNQLVLDAIADTDPRVQAAATRQIRDRHVPGAMAVLLKQVDSPHEEVREASCEALSEFSFANFLAGFEGLNEDARRTTGALVKKVDPHTPDGLIAEMEAKSRKRRLRAVEMADVMELVPALVEPLLLLLGDEDHLIRAAAADALQFCPTQQVQTALRGAANDPSGAVRNAARESLAVFDEVAAAESHVTAVEANE